MPGWHALIMYGICATVTFVVLRTEKATHHKQTEQRTRIKYNNNNKNSASNVYELGWHYEALLF